MTPYAPEVNINGVPQLEYPNANVMDQIDDKRQVFTLNLLYNDRRRNRPGSVDDNALRQQAMLFLFETKLGSVCAWLINYISYSEV